MLFSSIIKKFNVTAYLSLHRKVIKSKKRNLKTVLYTRIFVTGIFPFVNFEPQIKHVPLYDLIKNTLVLATPINLYIGIWSIYSLESNCIFGTKQRFYNRMSIVRVSTTRVIGNQLSTNEIFQLWIRLNVTV